MAALEAHPRNSAGDAPFTQTRKMTEAQFAHCPICDQWLGCQYWPLSKSVALHKRGTGHIATLWKFA